MKKITILGATGSIGTQTLDVLAANPEKFQLIGLSAQKNLDLLAEQIQVFNPKIVWVPTEQSKAELLQKCPKAASIHVVTGDSGLLELAVFDQPDLLVVAIVGTASLMPTYHAICHKISIALACKEVMVAAGYLITEAARRHGVSILPIDSEHAAIKQCLEGIQENTELVRMITLTASGGPFLHRDLATFSDITVADALKHPNWSMGAKITVDSATMMNKGLEIIEAHFLFDIPYAKIDAIIHPQSIVHSFVETIDGNVLAHLGLPDMRFPIQYALSYPEKLAVNWPRLDLTKLKNLEFIAPDFHRFPLLKLALEVGKKGGSAPIILNAANEAAVGLFLQEKITFLDIQKEVELALEKYAGASATSMHEIAQLDLDVKHFLTHAHAH